MTDLNGKTSNLYSSVFNQLWHLIKMYLRTKTAYNIQQQRKVNRIIANGSKWLKSLKTLSLGVGTLQARNQQGGKCPHKGKMKSL